MKKISSNKFFKILLNYTYIIIGAYLVSLGINLFLLPHLMTTGGASGIATILYYLFNIPMGLTIICINIPLFLIAIHRFGIRFIFKTMVATTLMSIFLEIFTYSNIIARNPIDLFTSCIFGGIIVGLGLSLVFKGGGSTGGSDLLAQLIYQKIKIQNISDALLVIEMVIISLITVVFKNINIGLYSIIALYISTKVIDIIFTGIDYIKVVTIITRKSDKVVDAILNDLKRGATVTNSIGAHTKEEITTITCLITRPQMAKIKNIIQKNDSEAVMYITSANEVIGNGFNRE